MRNRTNSLNDFFFVPSGKVLERRIWLTVVLKKKGYKKQGICRQPQELQNNVYNSKYMFINHLSNRLGIFPKKRPRTRNWESYEYNKVPRHYTTTSAILFETNGRGSSSGNAHQAYQEWERLLRLHIENP